MHIVQINYRRPDMPKAEWEARYTDERARQFLDVPGLLWKIWLDGEEERLAGGIYLFADRASAEAYAGGPIVARMQANPDFAEVSVRVFAVRRRMSEITRAPIDFDRLAAE
ncbi:YdhR family protein [Roseicella aquatilis]|uniref:Monooxygenase n=1 Tax=Roseicella aquatilis TaxID=2527868 RepID=A0A4R4DY99_9PROT|nr:YdhR family protein [Roseicella aquatilis]TCZ66055.1 hypothetical protein EXY23_02935 [Roseicella aquatilis]